MYPRTLPLDPPAHIPNIPEFLPAILPTTTNQQKSKLQTEDRAANNQTRGRVPAWPGAEFASGYRKSCRPRGLVIFSSTLVSPQKRDNIRVGNLREGLGREDERRGEGISAADDLLSGCSEGGGGRLRASFSI